MADDFSLNLFKGRLGEVVVETIFVKFEYEVKRAGYEQLSGGKERIHPDLKVGTQTWVEVK